MSPEIQAILTNKEVIAVNQDPLGIEGRRVRKEGDLEVWARPLQDGSRAVVLLNRAASEREITVSWENLNYPGHLSASIRDLWKGGDLGAIQGKVLRRGRGSFCGDGADSSLGQPPIEFLLRPAFPLLHRILAPSTGSCRWLACLQSAIFGWTSNHALGGVIWIRTE
jgi:hypothetical protein